MNDEVPEKLDEVVSDVGIYVPEENLKRIHAGQIIEGSMDEMYQNALNGMCMTCGRTLGRTSLATIGAPHVDGEEDETYIIMIFCSGQCHMDMQVMGWIQTAHDDIVQAIQFRGGTK